MYSTSYFDEIKKQIPNSTFYLQLTEEMRIYTWEVAFKISKSPKYKYLSGLYFNYEYEYSEEIPIGTNFIQMHIKSPKNFNKSILKRIVLIEKTGHNKGSSYSDPLIKWSLQQIFPSEFKNVKDFQLIRTVNSLTEKTWLLTECILTDSEVWRRGEYFKEEFTKEAIGIKIAIKPNLILLYP